MKLRAYLDIETTGLNPLWSDVTVIGVALERGRATKVVQLYQDSLYAENLLEVLEDADELYTYNGTRFDLPFIKHKLNLDLKEEFYHTDLMYDCWRSSLKGGLKVVEQLLGISRKLTNVDGYMAIQLWWDYCNENNQKSLRTLLQYNREDVVNLGALRRRLGVK